MVSISQCGTEEWFQEEGALRATPSHANWPLSQTVSRTSRALGASSVRGGFSSTLRENSATLAPISDSYLVPNIFLTGLFET